MRFSSPIKPNGAYITDHSTLSDLANNLQYASGSIEKLRDAVDGYLKSVQDAMDKKIQEVEKELEAAKDILSAAEDALDACRSRVRYNSEGERIEPNCSCEERDVAEAREVVNRIEDKLKNLRDIKNDADSECESYRKPSSLITIFGGGDSVLEYLSNDLSRSANSKLEEVMDVVRKYLKTSMGKDVGTVTDEEAFGEVESEDTKAAKFKEAAVRVAVLYGEQHEASNANAVAICPRCGRPTPIACICGMEARQRIYDNSLQR